MSQLFGFIESHQTRHVRQPVHRRGRNIRQFNSLLSKIWRWLQLARENERLRQQNQQLLQEMRERQQAEQMRKTCLHSITHDLRNPMVGMSLTLQSLLAQQQASLTIERQLLEAMWHSCQRQQWLLDTLVEVESPASHWQGKKRNWVSLTQLIEELRLNWQPVIASHGAAIEYRISQDLPLVWSDKNQVWRVFENLIGNALKHNSPGVTITLEVAYEQGTSAVQCTVADDGVGITAEQIPQLFKPYGRGEKADSLKGQKLGINWGLGLYICRQIVEEHGGEIGVESRPGKGAKFCFTLPTKPTV